MRLLLFSILLATATTTAVNSLPWYKQDAIPSGPPEFPIKLNWPTIVQPVAFHVIHKTDGTGRISQQTLINQITKLNDAFSGNDAQRKNYSKPTNAGIKFVLDSIDYTINDDYFQHCTLWNYQPTVKNLLFKVGKYNVYICNVSANLGLSMVPFIWYKIYGFPNEPMPLPEDHWYLGTFIDYNLLTGSTYLNGRWSQGLMLVHETGHNYGLLHLYQGSCIGTEIASDNIVDTPMQLGNPSNTCKKLIGLDSCPKLPGKDDNSNYMSINYDSCRSHFTPGQVSYMRHIIALYKPKLNSQTISRRNRPLTSSFLIPLINELF